MARRLRVQFPGAIYHLISRGDRREDIFRDDHDRERFLQTLEETCIKAGWLVHAFCLMGNHFHLVVETPQPNLVAGMKWFLGTYTTRFNRRHKLTGHLFSGRYKAQLVGGEGGYLRTACDYVHLNPARARLITAKTALKAYRWSSFPAYMTPAQRPAWLRVERLLGEHGIPRDSDAGRKEFEGRTELRRAQVADADYDAVRRDWCLGDDRFRKELLAQANIKAGKSHYGPEMRANENARAERIVTEELKRLKWQESELPIRRKGEPDKLAIAQRLRRETTMTVQWIADRLRMGTRGHLTHLFYWAGRELERAAAARKSPPSPSRGRTARNPTVSNPEARPAAEKQYVTIPSTDPVEEVIDPMTFD